MDINDILKNQDKALKNIMGNQDKVLKNVIGSTKKSKQMNLGLNLNSSNNEPEPLKRKTYSADFYNLMEKQNHLCADPLCAKRHGKKQTVNSMRDMDHIIALKLWELMKKKGNVNEFSNLQLLCPGCHRVKNANDRKKIAEFKQKKSSRERQQQNPFGLGF